MCTVQASSLVPMSVKNNYFQPRNEAILEAHPKSCSLVPRLPCFGMRTLKLCRRGEPGIFCHVKSAKGREEVERT